MANHHLHLLISLLLTASALSVDAPVIEQYDMLDYYPQCQIEQFMGMCQAPWAIVISKGVALKKCMS